MLPPDQVSRGFRWAMNESFQRNTDAYSPFDSMPGWPFRRVVIGMLIADHLAQERIPLRVATGRPGGQAREIIDEGQLVGRVHLHDRRRHCRVVERTDGKLDAALIFVGQRRAAISAKAAPRQVRALEPLRLATRPHDLLPGNKRTVKGAERLLAHAAMADRRSPQPSSAKPHGAALTAAGDPRIGAHFALAASGGQALVSWSGC